VRVIEELYISRETVRQIVTENLEMRKICAKMILHHDNASAHDALRVREFLVKNSITKRDHPPYSPDLAPCNFWLFPKLKKKRMKIGMVLVPRWDSWRKRLHGTDTMVVLKVLK
jgi:transposase